MRAVQAWRWHKEFNGWQTWCLHSPFFTLRSLQLFLRVWSIFRLKKLITGLMPFFFESFIRIENDQISCIFIWPEFHWALRVSHLPRRFAGRHSFLLAFSSRNTWTNFRRHFQRSFLGDTLFPETRFFNDWENLKILVNWRSLVYLRLSHHSHLKISHPLLIITSLLIKLNQSVLPCFAISSNIFRLWAP